jgi:hypothetical protein
VEGAKANLTLFTPEGSVLQKHLSCQNQKLGILGQKLLEKYTV